MLDKIIKRFFIVSNKDFIRCKHINNLCALSLWCNKAEVLLLKLPGLDLSILIDSSDEWIFINNMR